MPLRAYEPVASPCRLCGTGFDVMQSARAKPLSECPRCGAAVRPRAVTSMHAPQLTKPTSVADAKSAGFTVLKRIGRGEYEKQ